MNFILNIFKHFTIIIISIILNYGCSDSSDSSNQNNPLGTGDALLKTKKFIKNEYFLMLLPDDLIIKKNCSKEMIKIH